MRISKIKVNNFKSLVDFEIDLAKFNCLIGLNGSGKSTFLQFVDFLSHLMKGDSRQWYLKRDWSPSVIFSHTSFKSNLIFHVEFCDDSAKSCGFWEGEFSVIKCNFVAETISYNQHTLYVKENEHNLEFPSFSCRLISENDNNEILNKNMIIVYESSILSMIKSSYFDCLKPIQDCMCNVDVFDQFSPVHLQQASKNSSDSVGLRGESIGAFLHEIGQDKLNTIVDKLKPFFPFLRSIVPRNMDKETWQVEIQEEYPNLTTTNLDAPHVNDGLLRLLAFLAELESRKTMLLFDEIENGINPELIGFLLKELIDSEKQIVVTTHSPLILNYLDDETAIPSVHFFYKTPEGAAQTVPFLSIPAMREKLDVMGPGEAFIDTNLVELSRELADSLSPLGKEK